MDLKLINMFGYHLTLSTNLNSIREFGLLPMCGERSLSIGDFKEALYFYPAIILTPFWIKALYSDVDIYDLSLLRFSLSNVNFKIRDGVMGDCFTFYSIPSEEISVLRNYCPLNEILSYNSMKWESIKSLKK